ncbi:MAG: efflux RND transporter periplasmic adaptor subunit [Vicinamibacterales bacterium]
MRTPARAAISVVLATGIFLAGYVSNRQTGPEKPTGAAEQSTSYVCPMHPQFKLDHPGDCGICGMRLVPEGGSSNPTGHDLAGAIMVGPARQQLIGVRTDEVRRESTTHVLRVPGRIAVDEQRLHRIIAAVDGWIVSLGDNTVGRSVKKNQLLASYYTTNLLYSERMFLLSIPTNQQLQPQTREFSQASIRTAGSANPEFPVDTLRSLGMSDLQIEEIQRTRTASPHVNIYSPASGFVLARNVSPSQRFDKGTELYRIADIGRLWVWTDIFEKDRQLLEPGAEASVIYQGRRFKARMSDALPQFDSVSQTLKTRFELDNPGFVLQPDMFVDVELNVEMPSAITVPADAVFDSGIRRTVFVDRGNGNFEARRVETGWRFGDRVEILGGLMEGEHVVSAANFLLDSESRMQAASAGVFKAEIDPVCRMDVDRDGARAGGRASTHNGVEYYFCSDDCKKKFDADPAKYLARTGEAGAPVPAPPIREASTRKAALPARSQPPAQATDPVCGMEVEQKTAAAAGLKSEHAGRTYYFCSRDCKDKFDARPADYLKGY